MASRKTVINRFINRKKAIKIILYGSLARKLLMRFEAKRINDKRKLSINEISIDLFDLVINSP